MTLAAVDEGILRLTKYDSPDPFKHFFAKRHLNSQIHDDYARMLDPNQGAAIRSGGDQIGGEGLTAVPTQTVALFSGLVELDENHEAVTPLDLPDFNGELRLMAVAWSAEKLGAAAQPRKLRDPVPVDLVLPRFLAPEDKALAAQTGQQDKLVSLITRLAEQMRLPENLHTQEKAFLLLAVMELLKQSEGTAISKNDTLLGQASILGDWLTPEEVSANEIVYRNDGEGTIFVTQTLSGLPIAEPPLTENGFTINKRFANLKGESVDPIDVRQGDQLVVILAGRANDDLAHPAIIADLLPAGWEIEQILRAIQIERRWSKKEILTAYLTLAPYGENLEGVRAASLAYFGKEPHSLNRAQQALLIALPQAPETRRPDRYSFGAKQACACIASKLEKAGSWPIGSTEMITNDALPKHRRSFPNLAWHATAELAADPAISNQMHAARLI